MFRGMPMTDLNLPLVPANGQRITRHQAVVAIRQRRDRLAIAGTAFCEFGQPFVIQPMLAELLDHETGAMAADLVPDDMCRQEFAGAHPKRSACPFHQPGGKTEMIRMEMGNDQARDRAIETIENPGPCLANVVFRKAG